MAIAVSWVGYDPVSFVPQPNEITALDMGNADFSSTSQKFVIGLKFQGSSVQNVHLWRDSDQADVYYHDTTTGNLVHTDLRLPLQANGYVIAGVVDPPDTGNAMYNNPLEYWTTIPVNNQSPTPIGTLQEMDSSFTAYSESIGIAVITPAPNSSINGGNPYKANIVNWRLIVEFDTTDNV